ncbi:hypothetical protein ACGGAQ_00815 [Micromonospora sp. NPDC047557]|uniref:hypothetical protein n=1 Tax=Micromonospora sp. NPDC047557 TaxID=3364250 RepID=UPI003710A7C9
MRDNDILILELQSPSGDVTAIRVFSVAWRVETVAQMLVGSYDDPVDLPRMVHVLEGATMTNVSVSWPSLDTIFVFGDLRLRVFSVTSRVDPRCWQQWSARMADGRVLDVGPGQTWTLRERGPKREPQ